MQNWQTSELSRARAFFKVLHSSHHTQIATMVLSKGQVSGEYGTDHPHADQILLVLAGEGTGRVGDETVPLTEGSILLVEAGEKHQITCTSEEPFKTLNFYSPIAYPDEM